jgi:hypothetical protein
MRHATRAARAALRLDGTLLSALVSLSCCAFCVCLVCVRCSLAVGENAAALDPTFEQRENDHLCVTRLTRTAVSAAAAEPDGCAVAVPRSNPLVLIQ